MEYPILNFEAKTIDKNNTRNTNKRHNNKLISQQKQIFLQDDLVQLKTKRKNPDVNTYNEYITLQKQQDEYIYKHQQKYIIDKQELNKCIIYTCNQYQEHIKKKEECNTIQKEPNTTLEDVYLYDTLQTNNKIRIATAGTTVNNINIG